MAPPWRPATRDTCLRHACPAVARALTILSGTQDFRILSDERAEQLRAKAGLGLTPTQPSPYPNPNPHPNPNPNPYPNPNPNPNQAGRSRRTCHVAGGQYRCRGRLLAPRIGSLAKSSWRGSPSGSSPRTETRRRPRTTRQAPVVRRPRQQRPRRRRRRRRRPPSAAAAAAAGAPAAAPAAAAPAGATTAMAAAGGCSAWRKRRRRRGSTPAECVRRGWSDALPCVRSLPLRLEV